jgi:hypothetical protein
MPSAQPVPRPPKRRLPSPMGHPDSPRPHRTDEPPGAQLPGSTMTFDPALLRGVGDVRGKRVLLIGRNTLDLMCGMIRGGATSVTSLRPTASSGAEPVDLALVPDIACLRDADPAIRQARHCLTEAGRIVLRLTKAPTDALLRGLRRTLAAYGFSAIQIDREASQIVLSAQLPLVGQAFCH